jgi:hypothetical protein
VIIKVYYDVAIYTPPIPILQNKPLYVVRSKHIRDIVSPPVFEAVDDDYTNKSDTANQ